MKHKHADIIKAWADGVPVQCFCVFSNTWKDAETDFWEWSSHDTYRIKPKGLKYRVALMASAHSEYISFAASPPEAKIVSEHTNFIRWLTEWIEVAT